MGLCLEEAFSTLEYLRVERHKCHKLFDIIVLTICAVISLSARMVIHGANLGEPHTKALGGGLFELHLKGVEGIARVFYCTLIDCEIMMLHSYVKKSQKIPINELRIAKNRMNGVKHEH
jgi:hypothetical protein